MSGWWQGIACYVRSKAFKSPLTFSSLLFEWGSYIYRGESWGLCRSRPTKQRALSTIVPSAEHSHIVYLVVFGLQSYTRTISSGRQKVNERSGWSLHKRSCTIGRRVLAWSLHKRSARGSEIPKMALQLSLQNQSSINPLTKLPNPS